MTTVDNESVTEEVNELVITRVLDAPRERVWQVWSEAEHLANWWGPKESKVQVNRFEFHPGGIFHYSMEAPNGGVMWGKFVYREIASPERLSYISSFADEDGNVVRAPFSAQFPLKILNTVTMIENGGQTTITLRGGPVNATAEERQFFNSMHSGMQQGFGGMLDVLEAYLANQ